MGNYDFILTGLIVVVAMALTYLCMISWDSLQARLNINKIIGSTAEDQKKINLVNGLISAVSFNHEENRKKLISAGIYS
ncbi:type II secretion system F family protein, partial [Photobacterium swingsii]